MYGNPYYEPYQGYNQEYLEHYGVLGMKWGVRRYQNLDGTLTPAGKKKLENYKFKQYNKVSKQATFYKNSVDRYRKRKATKGVKIKPERNREMNKKISDYKKELKAIERMKFSDMQDEKVAAGKQYAKLYGAALIAGVPGMVVAQAVGAVKNPEMKLSEMRIERYEKTKKS